MRFRTAELYTSGWASICLTSFVCWSTKRYIGYILPERGNSRLHVVSWIDGQWPISKQWLLDLSCCTWIRVPFDRNATTISPNRDRTLRVQSCAAPQTLSIPFNSSMQSGMVDKRMCSARSGRRTIAPNIRVCPAGGRTKPRTLQYLARFQWSWRMYLRISAGQLGAVRKSLRRAMDLHFQVVSCIECAGVRAHRR